MTKSVPNTITPVITVAKKRGRKSKNEIALANAIVDVNVQIQDNINVIIEENITSTGTSTGTEDLLNSEIFFNGEENKNLILEEEVIEELLVV